MTFADRQSHRIALRGRIGTGAAVVALHIGIGAALLSTFAGGVITRVVHDAINANDWTFVPPPPPTPTQSASPKAERTQESDTIQARSGDLNATGPLIGTSIDLGGFKPVTLGDSLGTLPDLQPRPRPTASFAALQPNPRGNPADWVSRKDYPARAIREEWTGVTHFRVTVGIDGRVNACEVIDGSGHAELDRVACDRVSHRARFDPARDDTGATVPGTYQSAIRWQLTE